LLATKDAKYVRDTYWQDVRKQTVERYDASKVKTGEESKEVTLSEVSLLNRQQFVYIYFQIDMLILDTIGKDVADGVGEPDSIEADERSNVEEEVNVIGTPTPTTTRKRKQVGV
jgi:hypothetical protein